MANKLELDSAEHYFNTGVGLCILFTIHLCKAPACSPQILATQILPRWGPVGQRNSHSFAKWLLLSGGLDDQVVTWRSREKFTEIKVIINIY